MDCSMPGFPIHHQLMELTRAHVHWVDDAIQPSHPLSSPSPPAFNHSQHQGLFKWVSSSHQVARVLSLNKSTSYLSLCILLNSFCDQTQRTWALLISETRCVISIKKKNGSSPNLCFDWVWVPACRFKSQSGLCSFTHKSSDEFWLHMCTLRLPSFSRQ